MNRWDCTHADCLTGVAIGVGGAAGLRAIGWHFEPSYSFPWRLYCPAHHPRGIDAARKQAAQLQTIVAPELAG